MERFREVSDGWTRGGFWNTLPTMGKRQRSKAVEVAPAREVEQVTAVKATASVKAFALHVEGSPEDVAAGLALVRALLGGSR
jgi:hypothetical protein